MKRIIIIVGLLVGAIAQAGFFDTKQKTSQEKFCIALIDANPHELQKYLPYCDVNKQYAHRFDGVEHCEKPLLILTRRWIEWDDSYLGSLFCGSSHTIMQDKLACLKILLEVPTIELNNKSEDSQDTALSFLVKQYAPDVLSTHATLTAIHMLKVKGARVDRFDSKGFRAVDYLRPQLKEMQRTNGILSYVTHYLFGSAQKLQSLIGVLEDETKIKDVSVVECDIENQTFKIKKEKVD